MEWLKEYFHRRYWRIDLCLWRYYSFGRAYGVSLRNRPESRLLGLTYGETPARSFFRMLSWLDISDSYVFWELGSGTGRLSLMLASQRSVQTVAMECIVPFVDNANRIARSLSINGFVSVQRDFFTCSWAEPDIIYITATAFSEEQVLAFQQKSLEMKEGAHLFSLTHLPAKDGFALIKMDVISTSWGSSTVYLSKRIAESLKETDVSCL